MLRKTFLAAVCAVGLSSVGTFPSAYADAPAPEAATDVQQAALDAQILAVEALIVQYQNDPAGLQAAIESLIVDAANPEIIGDAVLIVFDHSQNPAIIALLANNADLAKAGGQGLGAAIAIIGVTDPDLATQMAANVTATGSSSFTASVETGDNTQTASLQQQQQRQQQNVTGSSTSRSYSSTPEKPASAS